MEPQTIEIKNAREHNLKGVSLSLPRNKLICFTGVSGSGKSSLAFDTLYAEGQRRYVESLSSYARQFMGQMQKPDVDLITGLSPAIAIQQKTTGWNPRSTVGTITAIHDFLRVLYARVGTQHCTSCGRPISAQSTEQIVAGILDAFGGAAAHSSPPHQGGTGGGSPARVLILAPVARGQKGEFRDLFEELVRAGYTRARVDGRVVALTDDLSLQKNQRHDIEVVIDRLEATAANRSRLAEAVQNALGVGKSTLVVAPWQPDAVPETPVTSRTRPVDGATGDVVRVGRTESDVEPDDRPGRRAVQRGRAGRKAPRGSAEQEKVFSSRYACTHCNLSYQPPSPQLFSFNSPTGMCMRCDGLGEQTDFDPDLLVPDPTKNFFAPCIAPMRTKPGKWRRHIYEGVAKVVGFDLRTPWKDLGREARGALLYGTGDRHITYAWRWSGGLWKHGGKFEGVLAELREKYRTAKAAFVREYYEKFMRRGVCPDCRGARLNPQACAVRLAVEGTPAAARAKPRAGAKSPADAGFRFRTHTNPNLTELCAMSVAQAFETIGRFELTPVQQIVAEEILKEVRERLKFLIDVGLDYLTLDRTAPTLSGGELQRIRLAGQIGAGLTGVLYVLDEPSIGLHARDNRRLLDSLLRLRDMGNTVVVVEHDEETMRAADYIVDFGPGPGVRGGRVVAAGGFDDVAGAKESVTADYLTGRHKIAVPARRAVAKSKGAKPARKRKPRA